MHEYLGILLGESSSFKGEREGRCLVVDLGPEVLRCCFGVIVSSAKDVHREVLRAACCLLLPTS